MSNTIQSKTVATTPLSASDILAVVQGGVLKQTTVADVAQGVAGTFTPVFTPASGAFGTITYGSQSGQFVRFAGFVAGHGVITTDNFAVGTATGELLITGLPGAPSGSGGAITIGQMYRFDFGVAPTRIGAAFSTGASGIQIQTNGPNASSPVNMTAADLLVSATAGRNVIQFSFIYKEA